MSVVVKCPSCGTVARLSKEPSGKNLRCKKCALVFRVDATTNQGERQESDEPAGRSVPVGLIIAVVVVLLVVAVAVIAFVL